MTSTSMSPTLVIVAVYITLEAVGQTAKIHAVCFESIQRFLR
jgi:hypothetical protein